MQAILGVDIAKAKFDVCLKVSGKEKHKVFQNTQTGFESCFSWAEKHGVSSLWICLEATSWYGESLAEFFYNKGHKVSCVNPSRTKAFIKSKGLRVKTDKADAKAIAEFCEVQKPALWNPQSAEYRTLRDLYRGLLGIKETQQIYKNRLENERLDPLMRQILIDILKTVENKIKETEKLIKQTIDKNNEIKNKFERLSNIKGVGWITALAILVEMPDVEQFENARQYAAFVGLTPNQQQSGSSLNKRGRICKIGNKALRKALYMPAICMMSSNEVFSKFANKLRERGKCGKLIVVAIMRKFIHVCYGILKTGEEFNPSLAFENEK